MADVANQTLHILRELRTSIKALDDKVDRSIKALDDKVDRGFADVRSRMDNLRQAVNGESVLGR
jgi:heme oxygenase